MDTTRRDYAKRAGKALRRKHTARHLGSCLDPNCTGYGGRDLRRDFNAALCYFGNDPTRKAMLAAFWFIENVQQEDASASELFFKVRELVRKATFGGLI